LVGPHLLAFRTGIVGNIYLAIVMTLFANRYSARRSGIAQIQAGGDSLHHWLRITGLVMTHSVNEKNAQRAACGIRPRSGSIKPIEIIIESSDGKHSAGSEQANRSQTQNEATHSPCTKSLARCHDIKFSSPIRFGAGPGCCTTGFVSIKGFLLAVAS